ncbi:beta-galactosidase [Sphingomonas sp. BN140010]|uniref:Beta-galactosidase n=1 Tax=Sphingomonas arvum TaxID=2992113 RepID=A0ABT3JCV1_9SPHN|nr:beta-galactosidase [Sphingomonas sp. BN140010]MCW3796903.1 beta-galactosidase [Sphingomonas sp. BN140010]
MKLGVCYYPEQWPERMWANDARRMRDLGLSRVRIGEFAWSRIEPQRDRFAWDWYDRAIDTLADAGLELILGTPTATPPKWLIDEHPEILAWDAGSRPRTFGSRRHYCFSSPIYRAESQRITTLVGERYGQHSAVTAWQTDNEYGCHHTILSYSPAATVGFRRWLQKQYGDISALNSAWGTVFWSQEYRSFNEIDLPNQTVTEANPAHRLDHMRFASEEVVAFNREQAAILRRASPGRDIVHNFMGFFAEFDHHAVGADLDAAAWDSYPLGFLDQGDDRPEIKRRYMRQGHPDFAGFHHDLYRGCGGGRMWVLEQQPGPVNWAPNNPAPLPGMVRLWTWEAFAHGAELVSYFRWRQAPFAQEQMHAGLLRPDDVEAPAMPEVRQVAEEIGRLPALGKENARVALLFSYEAQWFLRIQPQGAAFEPLRHVFAYYSVLRGLGLDVDILGPNAAVTGYALVVVPAVAHASDDLIARLAASEAQVLIGCRSGSKTINYQIPADLPPGPLQKLIPLRVSAVESLPAGHVEKAEGGGGIVNWLEHVHADCPVRLSLEGGRGIWFSHQRFHYLAGWPDQTLMRNVLLSIAEESGLSTKNLPDGLRISRRGVIGVAVNYAPEPLRLPEDVSAGAELLLGDWLLPPGDVAIWREAGNQQG